MGRTDFGLFGVCSRFCGSDSSAAGGEGVESVTSAAMGEISFAPAGLVSFLHRPRGEGANTAPSPWAAFFRRYAASALVGSLS